jgi:hypothetical protein
MLDKSVLDMVSDMGKEDLIELKEVIERELLLIEGIRLTEETFSLIKLKQLLKERGLK